MWEIELSVLPISWSNEGDEWAHHLGSILTGMDVAVGSGLSATGNEDRSEVIFDLPAESMRSQRTEGLRSRLRVIQGTAGIVCSVIGDDESVAEDQVRPWCEAVAEAAQLIGRQHKEFAWTAIIGPDPYGRGRPRPPLMDEESTVGPLRLIPGGVYMHELVASQPATAAIEGGRTARYSWPVIVEGRIRAFDYLTAMTQGRRPLHRTCALMSLISSICWVPRSEPTVQMPGGEGLKVPEIAGPDGGIDWHLGGNPSLQAFRDRSEVLTLPSWVESSWSILDTNPILATGLDAHYEAMQVEVRHPSLAFLTYVAAIEGMGSAYAELTKCDCCDTCTIEVGAGRRFREALKTIMTPKEARHLFNVAYEMRSKTAHEGRPYGTESTLGWADFSLFRFDFQDAFESLAVGVLRRASRQVLLKALEEAAAQSAEATH